MHQQVARVEAVLGGQSPVAVELAAQALGDDVRVAEVRRLLVGHQHRQVGVQRRRGVVLLADEDEDHAGHFLGRVGTYGDGADQLVIGGPDDRVQVAGLRAVRVAVVPAGHGLVREAHRLGGQLHAAVQAAVGDRIHRSVGAAGDGDVVAADRDADDAVDLDLFAEAGRVPVVGEAPVRLDVRAVLPGDFGGVADR
ncbi:hypothetical protein SDC9_98075 [bioreactor metagenome]|uniref:Uncharacterized protein n=1 Tax=bioreactor metagenome TaxID=1076179 RepID=A0A645AE77_9ZZZZ